MKRIVFLMLLTSFIFAQCNHIKIKLFQDFESTKIGDIPQGWMMGSTNQKSLGIWEVVEGKNVYMRYPRGSRGEQYNLLYTKDVYFLNGICEAKIKASEGRENRGGGIVWRLRDRKNYYMAIIDPLKNEFSIKAVIDGKTKEILKKNIDFDEDWQTLKVIFCKNSIKVFLNKKLIADIKDDSITHRGGAGILTKADAKTFFDDVKIEVFE